MHNSTIQITYIAILLQTMIQSARKRSKMELAMSLKKNMQALIKTQRMIVFLYYKIITFFCDSFKIPRPKIKKCKKRFLIEIFFIFGDLADLQSLLRRIICFIFLI